MSILQFPQKPEMVPVHVWEIDSSYSPSDPADSKAWEVIGHRPYVKPRQIVNGKYVD